MIRSVFRTVDYVQGDNGYLLRKELWLVMALLKVVHPSKVNGLLKGRRAARILVRMQTLEKVPDPQPLNVQVQGAEISYPRAVTQV